MCQVLAWTFFPSLFSFTFNLKMHIHASIRGGLFQRTARGTQFSASTFWILRVSQSGLAPSTFTHWTILPGLLYFWGRLWSSADWTQASFVAMDSLWSSGLSLLSAGMMGCTELQGECWFLPLFQCHSLVVPPSSFLLFLTRPWHLRLHCGPMSVSSKSIKLVTDGEMKDSFSPVLWITT